MSSIIQDPYYDNIYLESKTFVQDSSYAQAVKNENDIPKKLMAVLDDPHIEDGRSREP